MLLVGHFLASRAETWADLGIDRRQPARDIGSAVAIAAIIGGAGLGLYLAAFHLGLTRAVIPVDEGGSWWQVPVLVLSAVRFGIVEEVIGVGYLTRRLGQLRWTPWAIIVTGATLRGAYHLYQGYGAFVGNAVMGALFVRWRLAGRRTGSLVIAHALIDCVSFVGWVLLHDHIGWLPGA